MTYSMITANKGVCRVKFYTESDQETLINYIQGCNKSKEQSE